VFVPHPIFPQTKEETFAKADAVVEQIVKRLTEKQGPL
jgi:hypothetical protein